MSSRSPQTMFALIYGFLVVSTFIQTTFSATLPTNELFLEPEFAAVLNIHARSEGGSAQDPTHQHPQKAPHAPIGVALPANTLGVSGDSALARRDATACLSDGTCADGSCCSTSGTCGYGPTYCGLGNCTSGCDATAMCGKYSAGGAVKCGMNLCCSALGWCGTTDSYCTNSDPQGSTLPCQVGFGSCEVKKGKTCPASDSTTSGRTIGYYQASNSRDRLCNRISPSDIVTTPTDVAPKGYSHLYFAFASIDPVSYTIAPADDADVPLYTEFTALKSRGLQTWIAVGGFDFSDANKATHGTWSSLVASPSNRAAFISSLVTFMKQYGFQGVDLDWEYPVDPKRGGSPADTANLVLLTQEMRAAFGTSFGISLTLAPDYWYLRYFDAKAMEKYVDFYGFMAYDLHGYWDQDVKTLGSVVRGQADIRDIGTDTLPLWFDELDASKINFGIALYGRGYTLSSSSCNGLLCPFSGPSKPGTCTNGDGVMSLIEIEQLIKDKGITPTYLADSMMKQITWDDQWIGYDDADTIAAKKAWADTQCFGGTMTWSVDFYSGEGSGMTPTPTTDGTCGKANGNTICGNWSTGNCCSSAGWCGSGSAYCASGCQSGDCVTGGETTDGTCGLAHKNTTCGSWPQGSCCSSAGYCGRSKAHCGLGCQSGACGWKESLGPRDCDTVKGTCYNL